MKKKSGFKKGLIVYICVLIVAIIVVDGALWSTLVNYEKEENEKVAAKPTVTVTPMPTNTPTPTPVPVVEVLVNVPKDSKVYVDGSEKAESELTIKEAPGKTFDSLYTFINSYKEYKNLPEKITIPSMNEVTFKAPVNAKITAKDSAGKELALTKTEADASHPVYVSDYPSDDTNYDAVTKFAFDMAVDYSLFTTGDKTPSQLANYFPPYSSYLAQIGSLDNTWYVKHNALPKYSDKKVEKFVGYSENLYFVHITMNQNVYAMYYGKNVDTKIDLSFWIVKLDGNYKIAGIIY